MFGSVFEIFAALVFSEQHSENCILIYFAVCFHGGFDNNGAIIGPRSTRHSNPEEHATYYLTTFSKELLVQVMNAFTLFFGCSLIGGVTRQV